jgi:thiamine biosynthesis lipoprotein
MFIFTGCSVSNLFPPKEYKETQFLMDTIIEITAYGDNSEQAVHAAFQEFARLHDITNNFDENSQVSRVSKMAGKQKVQVDPDLVKIVKRSNELSDLVDGTFDVSIGPLTELWGIGRKGDFIPQQEEIDRVLSLVNYHFVQVDEVANTIYLEKPGMKLDLGGIAKGYATDRAIDALKAQGITSALVNAGGDIRVIGNKPDKTPWRIGVQHPRNSDGVIAKLALTSWDTMESSGDYQRFIMKDGIRYSHILDPRTGRQPNEVTSVTMVMNSSRDADVLSTALFIVGVEKGLTILEQFPGAEAIWVTADGTVIASPGLEGKIEIVQ